MKLLKEIKICLPLIVIIFVSISFVNSLYNDKLVFNKYTRKFVIMQITDTHYGENQQKDKNTTNLVKKLINQVKPDMVALTGDALSGYAWDGKNTTFYYDNWFEWSSPFLDTKTPYAYTSGNHDTEAEMNITQIIDLDITNDYAINRENNHFSINSNFLDYKYPVTKSNYYIRIYSSYDENRVALILWFFDTGSNECENFKEDRTWGCINSSQVEWYENNSKLINQELGYLPESLAFIHIPLREYREVYNFRETYGTRGEDINCPKKQTFAFDSIIKIGKIRAVFAGHDHNNDFCGVFYGVELCYGRKTGYGGYGPDYYQRGARIIEISEYNNHYENHGVFRFMANNVEDDNKLGIYQYIYQEDGSMIDSESYNKGFKGLTDFRGRCETI